MTGFAQCKMSVSILVVLSSFSGVPPVFDSTLGLRAYLYLETAVLHNTVQWVEIIH